MPTRGNAFIPLFKNNNYYPIASVLWSI